jgi:hypothetical protein
MPSYLLYTTIYPSHYIQMHAFVNTIPARYPFSPSLQCSSNYSNSPVYSSPKGAPLISNPALCLPIPLPPTGLLLIPPVLALNSCGGGPGGTRAYLPLLSANSSCLISGLTVLILLSSPSANSRWRWNLIPHRPIDTSLFKLIVITR